MLGGAAGVMVLANIEGRSLTDPLFAPIWAEIDRRALPVHQHLSDDQVSAVIEGVREVMKA